MFTILMFLSIPYALWVLYVFTMGLYRAKLKQELTKTSYYLGIPFIILAIFVDLIANWTWASLMFNEGPKKPTELVTKRLKRYLDPEGFDCINQTNRWKLANRICTHLLDPFDKGHCS